jgi:hypothetical protein
MELIKLNSVDLRISQLNRTLLRIELLSLSMQHAMAECDFLRRLIAARKIPRRRVANRSLRARRRKARMH